MSDENLDIPISMPDDSDLTDNDELPEHDPENWVGPRSARSWHSDRSRSHSRSRRTPRPQTTTVPIVPHPSFFIFSPTNPLVRVGFFQNLDNLAILPWTILFPLSRVNVACWMVSYNEIMVSISINMTLLLLTRPGKLLQQQITLEP